MPQEVFSNSDILPGKMLIKEEMQLSQDSDVIVEYLVEKAKTL